MKRTYSLSSRNLLHNSLSLGCGLWLRSSGDLWLRGSLGLSSSLCDLWLWSSWGSLLDCGSFLRLCSSDLLLCGDLWCGLSSGRLWDLLCELSGSRWSCRMLDCFLELCATRHTLWLLKDTLNDTGLEGSVEERVVHGIGGDNIVVALDILLEGNATVVC